MFINKIYWRLNLKSKSMTKLENEFEKSVNGLVDQENITEDPPRTGGDTGAPDKGR